MILPIYLYGHPVLRKVSEDITKDYHDLKTLIANMWETMYDSEGIGLAAPQIGLNIRLIVIDVDVLADTFPELKGVKFTLINPRLEVLDDGEVKSRDEGCLSLPGIGESVKRTEKVRLTWLDEDFNPHDEVFEGYLSRVIQHEYDHLDGKMFVDRLSSLRKQMIKKKLIAMSKGNFSAHYKCKPNR